MGRRRYRGIRIGLIALAAVVLLMGLTGCTDNSPFEYSESDVRESLERWYPGEEVVIQSGSRLFQTWNCYFTDLPDAVFQVSTERSGGAPIPVWSYVLTSNAAEVVSRYLVDAYCSGGGDLDTWGLPSKQEGLFRLELCYSEMGQASEAAEQLSAFYGWAAGQPHSDLLPDAEYRFLPEEYLWEPSFQSEYGPKQGPEDDLSEVLQACAQEVMEYLTFYCLPSEDFSQEELDAYAQRRWNWDSEFIQSLCPAGIYRDDIEIPRSTFSGIAVDDRFSADTARKISYGGLYKLLTRLDIAVEGTPHHFSFTGADGHSYEFSYDFYRISRELEDGETQEAKSWYFLRDGLRRGELEKRYAPAILIKGREFQEMTGLQLRDRKPMEDERPESGPDTSGDGSAAEDGPITMEGGGYFI